MANKYHAVPTEIDGIRFASKKEARRYGELKLMLVAGAIRALIIHPRWELTVNGELIGHYTGDFAYDTDAGRVVEDVKGGKAARSRDYILRKKLMKALHQIEIVEV